MSAKDTMRRNKTAIQRILSADRQLILDKVYEKNLITHNDYKNLKNIYQETDEGHVIHLVDKIMYKGENTCKEFLNLLLMDEEIKMTYPDLQGIELNYTRPLSVPTQETATSSTGRWKAPVNKDDKKTVKRKRAAENPKRPAAKRVKVDEERKPKAANKPKVATKTKPKAANKPTVAKKTKPKAANKPKVATKTKPKAANKPKVATKTKPKAANKPKVATKTKPKAANKPKVATKTKPKVAKEPNAVKKPKIKVVKEPKPKAVKEQMSLPALGLAAAALSNHHTCSSSPPATHFLIPLYTQ